MKPKIFFCPLRRRFTCFGVRPPYRWECTGYGSTRGEAYQQWASNPIPF